MVLESEGLLRRYPGRGCFVSEITVQDIHEIFTLRELLEVEALRVSFERLAPQTLRELEEKIRSLTPEDSRDAYYETDRQLHNLLVSSCGNGRLMMILRMLNGQIEQLRRMAGGQPQRLLASRQEHLALLEALIAGDLELACQRLSLHIRNVMAVTLNVCLLGASAGESRRE